MKSLALLVWPSLLFAGTPGAPETPLAEATGDLDGDGRAERVHLERDGSLRVDDISGRELGRVMLAPGTNGTVAILSVEEQPLVKARVPQAKGRAAETVVRFSAGKLETIYSGTTGPVGDGERVERLRVDADGVVRYQTAPTVQRCDGDDMLFPERWDFAGHRFRPVEGEAPDGERLKVLEAAPGRPAPEELRGLLPDPLGMFHFTAASTSPDAERKADRLGAPRELEDGKPGSLWVAGPARGGRGAWVTARAPSERQLRALRLIPGAGWPRQLAILVEKKVFRVDLSGAHPVWVKLPEIPAASCVSLVVVEPHGGSGPDTSLAEVTLFTDVDVVGGLEQLVETVAAEKANAHAAEQVLARQGADAARAITARLSRSQAGRRRLYSTLAALKVPEAAAPLAQALETARDDERSIVVDGLSQLGAVGAAAARRVYEDRSQAETAQKDAAEIMGRAGGEAEVASLIHGAGEERLQAATLAALRAAQLRDEKVGAQVTAALAADSSCGAQVGVLARVAPGPQVDAAWRRCKTGDFTLKLRLVRSLKDPQLLAEAAHDPDPVVRAAAVESGGPLLISDGDPGVRRASLARAQTAPAETALQKDSWPMVRRTAAETLGRLCQSSPVLSTAVEKDVAAEVRREALVSLSRCGPVPLAFLGKVLKAPSQPVSVRELAAALAAKQGGPEAARLLAETVDDVLSDPAADERSASLAIACLRALGRLKDGSQRVLEALGAASNEPTSGAVRAASMDAIGQICPEGAGEALRRGQKDTDPMVRRSAKQALDKCKR